MPQIPRYFSQTVIQPTETPKIPVGLGGQVGEAMARVGEQMSGLGNQVDQVVSKLQAGEDLNFVMQATAEASQGWNDYDLQARQTAGEGARGHTENAKKFWDSTRASILGRAPTPEARQSAEQMLTRIQTNALNESAGFEAKQRATHFTNTLRTSLDELDKEAYRNPERLTQLQGIAKGYLAGAAHPGAGWMDADSANLMLEARRSQLAIAAFSGIMETDPVRARDEIKSGKWDDQFDTEKILQLTARAEARADRTEALGNAFLKDQMQDNLVSIRNSGTPIPGIAGKVYELYGEEAGREYDKKARIEADYFNVTNEIKFLPLDKAAEVIKKREPVPGTVGYADNLKAYSDQIRFLQEREKILEDDPAAYVKQAPEVKSVDDVVAMQEMMGVQPHKQRLFSKEEAANAVAKLNSMPAEDRVTEINKIAANSGKHFDLAFKDLVDAKLAPENHVLISLLDHPLSPAIIPIVSEVIKIGPTELRKDLPPKDVATIGDTVRTELSQFMNGIMQGDVSGQRVKFANDLQEVVTSAAIVYYRKGADPSEAATRAAQELINDRYEYGDNDLIIPKRNGIARDAGRIQKYLDNFKDTLETSGFPFDVPMSSDSELNKNTDKLKADYLDAVKRKGYWQINRDESGAVLFDPLGNPVHDAQGNFLEIKFDRAEYDDIPGAPTGGVLPEKDREGNPTPYSKLLEFLGPATAHAATIPSKYHNYIAEASKKHGVDADFIASVIQAESNDNPGAMSPKGAGGLMQLMPETARDMGVKNVFDAKENIHGGTKYLSQMLQRYNGNKMRALVAYNWGPKNADSWSGKESDLPDETRGYLRRVLKRSKA